MTADKMIDLDDIRVEIDRIDDAILALLAERMAAVAAVRVAKSKDPDRPVTAMRPGREAAIARRLIAQRAPEVPASLVDRVWREIISNATQVQIPHAIHACVEGTGAIALGLVYGQFGAATPVVEHPTASRAVRAVLAKGPDVAVVGPNSGDDDWVGALLEAGDGKPQVVACLPFVDAGALPQALVIGHAPREATGDDTTVIALLPAGDGDGGPAQANGAGGMQLPLLGTSGRWRLVGAKGLVSRESHLIGSLVADDAISTVEIVGAFANPIRLEEQA